MNSNIKPINTNTFQAFEKPGNTKERYYQNTVADKYTPQEQKYKKRKNIKDIVIMGFGATSMIAAGAFIFFTTGSSNKLLTNIKNGVKKLTYSLADKEKHISFEKNINKTSKQIEKLLNISANFTPIKDYGFRKFMFKLPDPIGKKPWQKITDVYSNINIGTTRKVVNQSADKVNRVLDWVNCNIDKLPADAQEQMKELAKRLNDTKISYFKNFDKRIVQMHESTKQMDKKLNLGVIARKMKDGLVTDILLDEAGSKTAYFRPIETEIESMTNGIPEMCQKIKSQINLSKEAMFRVQDTDVKIQARDYLKKIVNNLDNYQKMGNVGRDEKAKEILNLLEEYRNFLKEKNQPELLAGIKDISDTFRNIPEKKGIIEEMRILVRDSASKLDEKDKQSFKSVCEDAKKGLYESVKSERNMFDKDREIVVGSGPTDFLGLLAPFALLGGQLAGDKSKEEKVGITLQAGIPLIGGVGTYLYGLAKQFSGVQSLVTSFGFGAVLNLLGTAAFKVYKEQTAKKHPETAVIKEEKSQKTKNKKE